MPQATLQQNDERAIDLARAAIVRFLEERPDFKDTKRNSVDDLIMYLEVEEDSAEWLPQLANNTRLLSNLWHSLARNGPSQTDTAPANATPVSSTNNQTTPTKSKRSSPRILASIDKKTEEAAPEPIASEVIPATKLTDKVIEAEHEILPVSQDLEVAQTGTTLTESAMQSSRAVAEQFALVKYREQQLIGTNRTLEELTEALAQAKQQQTDAMQAYTHSLEELAQLLATSLGPKAGDFGKLFSRVVNTSGSK